MKVVKNTVFPDTASNIQKTPNFYSQKNAFLSKNDLKLDTKIRLAETNPALSLPIHRFPSSPFEKMFGISTEDVYKGAFGTIFGNLERAHLYPSIYSNDIELNHSGDGTVNQKRLPEISLHFCSFNNRDADMQKQLVSDNDVYSVVRRRPSFRLFDRHK